MAVKDLVFRATILRNLATIAIAKGNIIHCSDVDEYYYDVNDILRMQTTKVKFYIDRKQFEMATPVEGQLYYIEDEDIAYKYAKTTMTAPLSYIVVNNTDDVVDVFEGAVEELVPMTIFLGKTKYAPRTLATEVYTTDGSTVEDKLKLVTRICKSIKHITATETNQKTFEIPFPFENYLEEDNIMEIRIGTVYVDESRYVVSGNTLILEEPIERGRTITFVFWYNVSIYNASNHKIMVDGSFILDRSIPIKKLVNTTNDFRETNQEYLPTSSALRSMYDILLNKIEALSWAYNARAVSTGTGDHLKASVTYYALKPGSILELTLHTTMLIGADLAINNSATPLPIYVNDRPVEGGIYTAGKTINLKLSDDMTRFDIVNDSSSYVVKTFYDTYTSTGGESTITFNIPEYIPGLDSVKVYEDNLRLIQGINYTLLGNTITLQNYTANANEIYYFEVDKVVKNK